MAEVRETETTKDMQDNVLDRKTVIERPHRDVGFGWGLLLGVLLVAVAVVAFAYSQGSFQTAGREADLATQTAQVELNQTADHARQKISNATEDNSQRQQQPTSRQ